MLVRSLVGSLPFMTTPPRRAALLLATALAFVFLPGARADTSLPLELVETAPVETTLDHPDIPDAYQVWLEMIQGARTSIDLAQFYASNEAGSRLEPVVAALEAAADRGVAIRFLAEKGFYKTYPKTLDRLGEHTRIEMRLYDVRSLMGGILHAKLMIVDGREIFVGSQNFDWRALEHIQELGVRARLPKVGRAFEDVFNTDWALAGGADPGFRVQPPDGGYGFPVQVDLPRGSVAVTPVFSPGGWLPDPSLWDLDHLLDMLDGAERTIRVQLLSYRTVGRDRDYWPKLEDALRAAAARGVQVQMIVSDWSQSSGTIEGLQSLQALPDITVKIMTIPPWSGGFIPFARVVHAKYLVVDGVRSWVGTSNWEKSYFTTTRNAGLVIEGASFGAQLDAFFLGDWNSEYARTVDPCAHYEAPRRSR